METHNPAFLLLVAAALATLPLAVGADPEPLAPLVPQEAKEGTRQAYLTFSYRKTEDKRSETKGGPGNVGANKEHEQKTTQTSGRALLVVQDRNYLDLQTMRVEGPNDTFTEVPVPEPLIVCWVSSDPIGDTGVRSYARQTRVTGKLAGEHLAMNVWGPPEPQWNRWTVDTQGSDSLNSNASKQAGSDNHDMLQFELSSQDPAATFSFTFSSGCDVTLDKWEIPPKWSDHHYRDVVPRHTTEQSSERIEIAMPSWEQTKQLPEDDKDRWTRVVKRSKSGVQVTATRSKTLTEPPQDRFLGQVTQIDERLEIALDMGAADYEILITPPSGIKDWIPQGGNSLQGPGDKLNFKGRIHRLKGTAAADRVVAVNVELTSSRVPGRCMNWPRNGDLEPDLRLMRAGTSDKLAIDAPDLSDNEQAVQAAHGSFKVDEDFQVVVGCYDFGPYGHISFGGSVPVRIEGFAELDYVSLPTDENDNHVADAWERDEGVYDKKLPADWDEVAVPGQKHDGDGICLYERYRGFKNSTNGYARLKCDRKFVFLYDPANVMRSHGASLDFMNASQLVPLFISQDQWTGPGSQSNKKRIVNFNHAGPAGAGPMHRVDQHALHLLVDRSRQVQGRDVTAPSGWQRAYAAAGVPQPNSDDGATLGYGWPDCLPNGKLGRSPLDKYQISIYLDTIGNFAFTMASDAMAGADGNAKSAAMETYLGDQPHAAQFAGMVDHFLRWTLCHELGHGVGAQHHVPISGGDHTCFMRYPTRESYPAMPADPCWLNYTHWPDAFCRGGELRSTNGCYQHIQVTDYRENK